MFCGCLCEGCLKESDLIREGLGNFRGPMVVPRYAAIRERVFGKGAFERDGVLHRPSS